LTERQNSLNGLKTGKFGRADVNTIKKRKSHGLSFEAAGLEQDRPLSAKKVAQKHRQVFLSH
jgi:hypothetical protein